MSSRTRGVSLIESLLAFSVLLILIVFVFHLVPSSLLAIRSAEIRLQAQNLAAATLEEYRGKGFVALTKLTAPVELEVRAGPGEVEFHPTVSVGPAMASDPTRALQVAVNVNWQYRGIAQTLRLGTCVWNIGQ